MANYVENYLKFKNEKDFMSALAYIEPNGEINADLLVPMSNKQRDILKEILDGTEGWDNDDLKYFLESYKITDFWKKIHWGATFLYQAESFNDKLAINFRTHWSAAIGVVKALHDNGLDFIYLYKSEGYDEYNHVEFKSQTEVHDKILPKIGEITDDDFLRDTYKEFVRFIGGEVEIERCS